LAVVRASLILANYYQPLNEALATNITQKGV